MVDIDQSLVAVTVFIICLRFIRFFLTIQDVNNDLSW